MRGERWRGGLGFDQFGNDPLGRLESRRFRSKPEGVIYSSASRPTLGDPEITFERMFVLVVHCCTIASEKRGENELAACICTYIYAYPLLLRYHTFVLLVDDTGDTLERFG